MNCPQCNAPLPADAPTGLCPACLLKRGLEPNTIPPTIPSPSQWTPPTPDELAPFFPDLDILSLLGRGGMGAVYRARQKSLDRIIALKILPPQISHDPNFSQRFALEAQALARLNHPHIVAIYDFGQRGGAAGIAGARHEESGAPSHIPQTPDPSPSLFFFLMEYIDGLSLRQLLNTSTPPQLAPKDALAIVPQICDALQYAHDRGIVHRDIKPENILLTKSGQIKIADFGLAKLVRAEDGGLRTESPATSLSPQPSVLITSAAGTPQYMAPEQSATPDAVDHRADIYALGVVFYQMLTGELPHTPLTPPSTKVHIDVRLDEIVLRALEKSPALRYQNATEFKTQIETIATEISTPKSAQSPPSPRGGDNVPSHPSHPFKTPSHHRSRLIVGSILVAVLYVVFGSIFAVATPQTRDAAAISIILMTLLTSFGASTLGYNPLSRIPRRLFHIIFLGTLLIIFALQYAKTTDTELNRPTFYPSLILRSLPPGGSRERVLVEPKPGTAPAPFHPNLIPLSASEEAVARMKLQAAEEILRDIDAHYKAGAATHMDYLRAKADRDIAAAELAGNSAEIPRIKFNAAHEIFKEAEAREKAGLIDYLEYRRAKADRNIAAAELTGDPRKIADAKYAAAEEIYQGDKRFYDVGRISSAELRAAQLARDLAAAATQPAPSTFPSLPGRWESTQIIDKSNPEKLTHVTFTFSPDNTLTSVSDFADGTHDSAKGIWSLQNQLVQITIDDENYPLVPQNDKLLLVAHDKDGDITLTLQKTSNDFSPAPASRPCPTPAATQPAH